MSFTNQNESKTLHLIAYLEILCKARGKNSNIFIKLYRLRFQNECRLAYLNGRHLIGVVSYMIIGLNFVC